MRARSLGPKYAKSVYRVVRYLAKRVRDSRRGQIVLDGPDETKVRRRDGDEVDRGDRVEETLLLQDPD